MKVLVTGSAGFLGSNVIPALLARGDEVVAQDVVSSDQAKRLAPVIDKVDYEWRSVVDTTPEFLKAKGVDYILHFAALTDVPLANSSPRYTFQLNLEAAVSLFLAAKGANVPTMAMSTENIYGRVPPERLPAVEDEPPRPKNSYAASKVAVEAYAQSVSNQYGVPISFIRSSTLFGPAMRTKQVVAIFARQALTNAPITLEGDGSQTRDFNYVDNMVDAILRITSRIREGFNVWNIGSGTEWSLVQLVNKIIDLSDSKSTIVHRPWRPGEEGRLSISIEKAKMQLGYEPKISVEEGLRRLLASMRSS